MKNQTNSGTPTVTPDVINQIATLPMTSTSDERIIENDKLTIDLAKSKVETAIASVNAAKSALEAAEMTYRYMVLQLFNKYDLTSQDSITNEGVIQRGVNQ